MSQFENGTKGIPYGMMNFRDVILDNHYYVDKTHFIPLIERSSRFFFFIRPRRFGKSLLLNMLEYYYDINRKDLFEPLFGNLHIGKQPTAKRNSYLVLSLDFSGFMANLGSYQQALDSHCLSRFRFFCDIYKDLLPPGTKEELSAIKGANAQLEFLCDACTKADKKIYLLIDEYDHFTNEILRGEEHLQRYKAQTHGEGEFRAFFNKIKAGTKTAIERCFITGVSPVTLDDLTSGFNIGDNYTLDPLFNDMVGFTEEEVREMLTYYSQHLPFNHTVDQLIEIMRPWYDNYCFAVKSFGRTTMYNSNMVLYFLNKYAREGELPQYMIDDNIRTDYNKLRMLIRKDREFAHNASIIQTVVTRGYVTGELSKGFPAERITEPNNFMSLLFYFGMLTISGTYRGQTKLTIPNQVVRDQLYGYLLGTYNEVGLGYQNYTKSQLDISLSYDGEWRAYFEYIAQCIKDFSSQRDKMKGEAFVHGFTLSMTCHNPYYRPVSEMDTPEGFPDLFLCPKFEYAADIRHSYLLELKYAKSTESDRAVAQMYQDAKAQLSRYALSQRVAALAGTTTLHKLVILYHGIEMRYCEEIA